jgi:hypothetical protein
MSFSLRALVSFTTFCCVIAALPHYVSFQLPIHAVNAGILQTQVQRIHDVELIVWLPVTMLISYCIVRLGCHEETSEGFRLAPFLPRILGVPIARDRELR